MVVGLHVASREEVDRLYGEMIAAGHRGLQEPCDAFWGARYAIVEDPDEIAVGLMSPKSAEHRSAAAGSLGDMAKTRLDVALVERGLAETRTAAQRMVMAGLVFSGERRLDKPGHAVAPDTPIEVRGQPHPYVSRGGLKLDRALDHFAVPVAGRIALDVGASTGGFTDCLLQRGVAKVYAIDVGTNQLAWKLRTDPRVISMEKTNIREVTRADVPEPIDLVVCDASFIGLRTALPAALALARAGRASRGADQAAVRGRQGPRRQGRHRARA